jgi:hypothetical protein
MFRDGHLTPGLLGECNKIVPGQGVADDQGDRLPLLVGQVQQLLGDETSNIIAIGESDRLVPGSRDTSDTVLDVDGGKHLDHVALDIGLTPEVEEVAGRDFGPDERRLAQLRLRLNFGLGPGVLAAGIG